MRLRRIVVTALLSLFAWMVPASSTLAVDNPIVLENQQPGSSDWFWSKVGDDATGQIKGYASAISVNQNASITFYVTVNPAQTYSIDFYRMGWYGGMGARLRLHAGPLDGVPQPPCNSDPTTGLLECKWAPSFTLTVPSDWTSGVYAAKLTNAQGFQNYVMFVVKDGRPAPFLYQQSVNTDQAYNDYPNDGRTGKSLYAFNSYGANTVSGNTSAVKVSFDRPYADQGIGAFIGWEINFLRWLERSGYDVTYSTDIDTHANGGELKNHKAFLSVGHSEYWSKEMRDAAEAARDAGVNLAFFGANASYTQVRLESSSAGVPNRVVVEYRNVPWNPIDPVQGPTTTTNFRDPPVNRPEQTMLGIQYSQTLTNTNYVVINSSHWVYAGTGFQDGDAVPGIVGYEADSYMPNYPPPNSANHTLLSRSPFTDPSTGVTNYLNSSIYQAPSGAWVFASGTMSWSWALDDVPGPYAHFRVDPRIQQTTANILNAFLNGAPPTNNPTITSFTPTIAHEGTSVTISGRNFTGATAVRFNGTAASFSVTSDTAIQATVPTGAMTGPLSVTTPGGTATSVNVFTVARPPTITSFRPTSGRVGALVTINGASFTGATAVRFNGIASMQAWVVSDAAVQAFVPTGATTGPLSVTTPEGTATSATNFTVVSAPTITNFTPTSGPVGTSVTLTGTSFTGATAVTFNGVSASFTVTSDTAIQATVPSGATTGPLSVTTPEGTASSPSAFTVTVGNPPTITSFTPTSGPVGTSVTLTGTNFTGATAVTFNGVSASFTVTSATAIQATVPTGATTGPLSVTTPGGTATSASSFTVTASAPLAPTITSFTPTSGPVGTSVTLTGTNFTGATAVTFNGVSASFTVTSATAIQATVPAGATTGPLRVTTPGGTATSTNNFTSTASISFVQSNYATPQTPQATVTVTYAVAQTAGNLNIVVVGWNDSTAVVSSVTDMTGNVYTLAVGPTVQAGFATQAIYYAKNIAGAAANGNTVTVRFSVPAAYPDIRILEYSGLDKSSPLDVTAAATGNSATSNSGAATTTNANDLIFGANLVRTLTGAPGAGFISRIITSPDGDIAEDQIVTATGSYSATASLTSAGPWIMQMVAFKAASNATTPAPTITSFTPTSGPVGTSVTLSGTNFTGATAVTFNGVSASFTVTSATAIQATVPTGATTGPLSVTTPGGTATSASSFTVTASAPTITSFTPTNGPVGTSVTLSGTNFTGATAVTFNGVSASFTVSSATAIQATVPMGATTGPLRVTTPGGTATSTNNFAVTVTLTVTKTGIIGGTVTSTSSPDSPTQINCGATCSADYNSGTVVTLTATPNLLSTFSGWSGCDSASGTTCTVTMSAARTVTANFLP
jgi:N,N-dimethylformamidase beta subunit-like protein/IPT/TIG domain-containing protein